MSELTGQESEARLVTFFEDRAEVQRVVRVKVGVGAHTVAVAGISPLCHDKSLQVRVEGGQAQVVDSHLYRVGVASVIPAEGDIATHLGKVTHLRSQHKELQATIQRLTAGLTYVAEALSRWGQDLFEIPADVSREAASWEVAWTSLTQHQARLLTRLEEAEQEAAGVSSQLRWHERVLAELQQGPRHLQTRAEVRLVVAQAGEVELLLRYLLPCALWRPEHQAVLKKVGGSYQVEWTHFATVWQLTGEVWNGVEVKFSTARPSRPATMPSLEDDLVVSHKKLDQRTVVSAREEKIQMAGVQGGQVEVDNMPGVDDGGQPLQLSAPSRVNLPSSGEPVRIELGRRRLPAEVSSPLFSQKALAPHVRVTSTWAGETPLLPGPVHITRDTVQMGRSRVDFVAPGDNFELGFGPHDAVRCQRQVVTREDSQALSGVNIHRRAIKVFVNNLGTEPWTGEVVERLPVSELEGVEVRPVKLEGWRLGGDGFARHPLELAAGQRMVLNLEWELRTKKDVVGVADLIAAL